MTHFASFAEGGVAFPRSGGDVATKVTQMLDDLNAPPGEIPSGVGEPLAGRFGLRKVDAFSMGDLGTHVQEILARKMKHRSETSDGAPASGDE